MDAPEECGVPSGRAPPEPPGRLDLVHVARDLAPTEAPQCAHQGHVLVLAKIRDATRAGIGVGSHAEIGAVHVPIGSRGDTYDRYLVRLASTTLVDNMGTETTGKYLDELMRPEIYPARRALFDFCVQQGCPVYYGATLAAPTRGHIAFRRILLPLRSAADADIDLVCGAMEFLSAHELADGPSTATSSALPEPADDKGLVFRRIFRSDRWTDWSDDPLPLDETQVSR